MSAAALTTQWELHLKEYASAGFKKLTEYATGSQKKLTEVATGLTKVAQASTLMGKDFKRNYSGLEETLKGLEKRQKEAFTTTHILAYQKMIDRTKADMEKLNAITKPHKGHWEEMKEGLHESLNEIPGMGGIMGLATNPLAIGIGAASGAIIESTKLAMEYEDGMAKVNATAQLSKETLGQLQERMQEIGSESGGNFSKIPEAYDLIYKQTHKVNKSLDELEVATKGAQAGFIDLNIAADAEAKMAVVLGDQYTNATDVMDVFFTTMKNGNGDLAGAMADLPHLTELGKGVGLSFKDTTGIFEYFTKKIGETSDQANTDMQGVFNTLRSADVIQKFKDAGVSMYDKKHHLKKFDEIIEAISGRMKQIRPDMQMDFLDNLGINDPRKAKAILMLTEHVDDLKKSMDAANNSAGALDAAYEHSENMARTWGDIGDELKSWGVTIGSYVLPVIDTLMEGIKGIGKGFKDMFTGWGDDANAEQQKHMEEYNKNLAFDAASKLTKLKFGDKMNFGEGTETSKFFDEQFKKFLKDSGAGVNQKNNIDKKESATEKALKNVNEGKSAGAISGDSKISASGSSITGDGGKIRNLTMNLHVTNNNEVKNANDLHKLKQKITDAVVDAARDGMVTVGV